MMILGPEAGVMAHAAVCVEEDSQRSYIEAEPELDSTVSPVPVQDSSDMQPHSRNIEAEDSIALLRLTSASTGRPEQDRTVSSVLVQTVCDTWNPFSEEESDRGTLAPKTTGRSTSAPSASSNHNNCHVLPSCDSQKGGSLVDVGAESTEAESLEIKEFASYIISYPRDAEVMNELRRMFDTWRNIYMNVTLNIGVIGNSGVGKSAFINTLRRIQSSDARTAKSGVNQTTTTARPYEHRRYPDVQFRPVLGTTSVLFVDDMVPPADCEPSLKKYAEQELQPYLKSRFSDNNNYRNLRDIASPADCSFNSSSQPGDVCDPPCFSDCILDSSSPVIEKDDPGSDLKEAGKDIANSGDIKSAMKRYLSLHSFTDFSMVPASLLIYTLHSSDSVSEQDYVRNLMALPPEEREALMKSEAERLRTYGSGFWPIRDVMPPEELAAAGFYYTGVHDRVQCAFCRGVLRNWERGDSAMNEHRVHFSYCRLVMGLDCGNVPIASRRPNGENASAVATRGGQANLFASANSPLNDVPDNTSLANCLAHGNDFLATMGSGEPLPGVSTAKPKHPEHAVEARRLQSFSTWPLWALQSPENLAKAGFYYAGFGDSVKCFYCDGGLRNWEIMDNPWEEHARWFKECKYLLDVKGQGYVDEIQKKYAVGNEAARLEVTSAAAASKTSPGSSLEHPSVQLVKSLGYNESQILAALDCYFPEHQTGTMPKGAELLDAVLRMEDEASGVHPALTPAGRSMPTSGRVLANEAAAHLYAVAASRPSETTSMPPRVDRQRPEPDGISGPNVPVHSSRVVPNVKKQQEPPPSERPLASLHDIIFTGLLDLPDGETRFREENRQMHKHLECKSCRQRPAEVVLLPCGHFSSCLECVPSLRNCPVCVTVVRGTIRTYLC